MNKELIVILSALTKHRAYSDMLCGSIKRYTFECTCTGEMECINCPLCSTRGYEGRFIVKLFTLKDLI